MYYYNLCKILLCTELLNTRKRDKNFNKKKIINKQYKNIIKDDYTITTKLNYKRQVLANQTNIIIPPRIRRLFRHRFRMNC